MSKKEKHVPTHGFDTNMTLDEVIQFLNSTDLKENLLGMRDLIALMSHGVDTNSALPHVIKLVIHPDLNMRRVVYQFLTQFSESNPQQALMAVNILQRALGDKNALVRGLALRALTSIRVKDISEVARLSLEQHQSDDSPFVRKIVSIGISKLFSYCPDYNEQLIDLLKKMLNDHVPAVVGAAIQSFNLVCPDNWQLVNPIFHKICGMLNDFDEFEQVDVIQMFTRYVRNHFANPSLLSDLNNINDDLKVIYKAAALLLRTNSPSVVVETSSFLYHCSPAFQKIYEIDGVARSLGHAVTVALIRVLTQQNIASKFPVLSIIRQITLQFPFYFSSHYKSFFVNVSDNASDKIQKIQIISNIASTLNDQDRALVLKEIMSYVTYGLSSIYFEQQEIACYIIKCIGKFITIKLQLLSDVSKIDDFKEDLQCLWNPLQRVIDNQSDVNFANDVIFQQSLLEICNIFKQINQLDCLSSQYASEISTSILVSTSQIYINPETDQGQDSKYAFPKALWPSFVGFDVKYDPLMYMNEAHTSQINRKSICVVTRLQAFLFQQIRQLLKLWPVMQLISQNFHAINARCAFVDLFYDLRFVLAAIVPDALRLFCQKFVDEPLAIKQQILFFTCAVLQEIELFRAAPLYLLQRSLISESKKNIESESIRLTSDQISERLGNFDYAIRQICEYVISCSQVDPSLSFRDLSSLVQLNQVKLFDSLPASGVFPLNESIIGSISSLLNIRLPDERILVSFQDNDTSNKLREYVQTIATPKFFEVDNITKVAQQKLAEEEEKSKKKNIFSDLKKKTDDQSQVQPVDQNNGIVVKKAATYDEFLGSPEVETKKPDDSYYYSDEEPQQQRQIAQPITSMKPQLVKPTIVQKVTPQKIVQKQMVAQPIQSQPVKVSSPAQVPQKQQQQQQVSSPSIPQKVQAPVAQQPQQKNDMLDLFGSSTQKESAQVKPSNQQNNQQKADTAPQNADDLLSMLFQ